MKTFDDFVSAISDVPGVTLNGDTITIRSQRKTMRLRVNRRGDGYVTNYTVSIGSAEARKAGFLNEDGSSKELEKLIDEAAGTITIRVARTEG